MKVHEKARAYDELMKDVQEFLTELESHAASVDAIANNEEGKDNPNYYAIKVGSLSGNNFGLVLKIGKFKGTLNWYKNLK